VADSQKVYDLVRQVDAGMSAGIDPLILQRNQLASGRNVTVRGTFPTHRPAFVKRPLTFGDSSFQSAFEQALFQGAGYYKPDFGYESIIVSIAGRIFAITIAGNTATVTEIGISADPNSSTAPQSWMWQAEKWMIINDSQHLPVIFDGNQSRRSLGAAAQVATTSGSFTAPAQGATVNITMASTFSGPFNVPLRVTDAGGVITGLFQAVASGTGFTGYPVTLKNFTDTAGASEASGSELTSGTIVGTAAKNEVVGFAPNSSIAVTLAATPSQTTGRVGIVCIVGSTSQFLTGTISSYKPGTKQVIISLPAALGANTTVTQGTLLVSLDVPSTHVANLAASITAPAQFGTVSAVLDQAYTGALPQLVFINGKQYEITAVQTPTPSTAVVLLNLSATQGSVFATASTVTTIAELPAGRMGCYGLGRVWQALTDGISFIGGDIVGGSSGSSTYQKRDAVLKMQENNLLNGGGTFRVPGSVGDIRAMIFASVLDASLGQGPLAVVTPRIVFSCQAPADRTTWQNLTNPILTEGMKGGAGTGQDSTVIANSDIFMRSETGIRSYIQGRRDFDVWGNVPISREVEPFLATDDLSLLPFASAVEFDNRLLLTSGPVQSSLGVYWQRLIALNFDPISSLRGKAPSVYESVWDGLNILKLVKGSFAGVERCFAVCVNDDLTKIELHEILKSSDSEYRDNSDTPIEWEYETAALNFYEQDPRKRNYLRLMDGEIRIDKLDKTIFNTPIY
jgi:hypothetical protein